MRHSGLMTRRFTKLWTAGAVGAAVAPVLLANGRTEGLASVSGADISQTADDKLQSEFLFDLVFDRGAATNVGSPSINRVIVPVSGGTVEGPKLKGTILAPIPHGVSKNRVRRIILG